MPTGHTAGIYEDNKVTFPQFVWNCARAFGALVSLREEPSDAIIPERFEPSKHHEEQLSKKLVELAEVTAWSEEEADRQAKRTYRAALKAWTGTVREKKLRRGRYLAMLDQVRAWRPPSKEHEGLKDYMEKQLTNSIDFDCNIPTKPTLQTGMEFKGGQLEGIQWYIDYHKDHARQEIHQCNERNEWMRLLRESLAEA